MDAADMAQEAEELHRDRALAARVLPEPKRGRGRAAKAPPVTAAEDHAEAVSAKESEVIAGTLLVRKIAGDLRAAKAALKEATDELEAMKKQGPEEHPLLDGVTSVEVRMAGGGWGSTDQDGRE